MHLTLWTLNLSHLAVSGDLHCHSSTLHSLDWSGTTIGSEIYQNVKQIRLAYSFYSLYIYNFSLLVIWIIFTMVMYCKSTFALSFHHNVWTICKKSGPFLAKSFIFRLNIIYSIIDKTYFPIIIIWFFAFNCIVSYCNEYIARNNRKIMS